MSDLVRLHMEADHVAIVTLMNGKRRNALSLAINEELKAKIDQAETDDTVAAIVITGEPPSFCAGADLGLLASNPSLHGLREIYSGFLRVATALKPTIAAINGPAIGAGLNLALACDVRVAGTSAVLDARFLQIGLHPGGGHTWMLERAIGVESAMAMVVFGQALTGPEAAQRGLVWKCVADEVLLSEAVRLAVSASKTGGELVRRVKRTIHESAGIEDHEMAVELELEQQMWSMTQPQFRERMSSARAAR
jgi:enoyl-CoA hydratase